MAPSRRMVVSPRRRIRMPQPATRREVPARGCRAESPCRLARGSYRGLQQGCFAGDGFNCAVRSVFRSWRNCFHIEQRSARCNASRTWSRWCRRRKGGVGVDGRPSAGISRGLIRSRRGGPPPLSCPCCSGRSVLSRRCHRRGRSAPERSSHAGGAVRRDASAVPYRAGARTITQSYSRTRAVRASRLTGYIPVTSKPAPS